MLKGALPRAPWTPDDERLSEQMMSYWSNFAKTGDPNGSGVPAWPRYQTTAIDRSNTSTLPSARRRTQRGRDTWRSIAIWLQPGTRDNPRRYGLTTDGENAWARKRRDGSFPSARATQMSDPPPLGRGNE